MRSFGLLALVLLGTILASPASAATVDSIRGVVYFNSGQGYRQLVGATGAKQGDMVFATPGGSARIVCANGSSLNVRPGSVYTVDETCRAAVIPPPLTGAALVGGLTALGVLLRKNDELIRVSP